jgi:hypothetical protein
VGRIAFIIPLVAAFWQAVAVVERDLLKSAGGVRAAIKQGTYLDVVVVIDVPLPL